MRCVSAQLPSSPWCSRHKLSAYPSQFAYELSCSNPGRHCTTMKMSLLFCPTQYVNWTNKLSPWRTIESVGLRARALISLKHRPLIEMVTNKQTEKGHVDNNGSKIVRPRWIGSAHPYYQADCLACLCPTTRASQPAVHQPTNII